MQVEFFQQLFLDGGANAVAKQGAVGHDYGGATATFRAEARITQFAHDELQEQQSGFGGLHVGREIGFDTGFFLAAERWIGQNHIDAFAVADFGDAAFQGVTVSNLWGFQTMQ